MGILYKQLEILCFLDIVDEQSYGLLSTGRNKEVIIGEFLDVRHDSRGIVRSAMGISKQYNLRKGNS